MRLDLLYPDISLEMVFQLGAYYLATFNENNIKKKSSDIIDVIGIENILPMSVLKIAKASESKEVLLHFYESIFESSTKIDLTVKQIKIKYLEVLSKLSNFGIMTFKLIDSSKTYEEVLLINGKFELELISKNVAHVSMKLINCVYFIINLIINLKFSLKYFD